MRRTQIFLAAFAFKLTFQNSRRRERRKSHSVADEKNDVFRPARDRLLFRNAAQRLGFAVQPILLILLKIGGGVRAKSAR